MSIEENLMKNSWILSSNDKKTFSYYCKCSYKFTRNCATDKTEAPDLLCPKCGIYSQLIVQTQYVLIIVSLL